MIVHDLLCGIVLRQTVESILEHACLTRQKGVCTRLFGYTPLYVVIVFTTEGFMNQRFSLLFVYVVTISLCLPILQYHHQNIHFTLLRTFAVFCTSFFYSKLTIVIIILLSLSLL